MASSTTTPLHLSEAPIPTSIELQKFGSSLKDAKYPILAALLAAYKSHSYGRGYGVVKANSSRIKKPNKLGRRTIYQYDRWGKPQIRKKKEIYSSRKRANIGSRKCNCPFIIKA
jgi:hypothetical protein